jgi:hypothetical protein
MRRALPSLFVALALLFTAVALPISSPAQTADAQTPDGNETEDDSPVQRVARLTFIEGDVSFLRAGTTHWAWAAENLPLLEGDQLYTGDRSRAEIQLGKGSYVRLAENTSITISALTQTVGQFEVVEGIVIIRLERLGAAFDRFEVDTPNVALVLQQDGLYRVNLRVDGSSEIISRRGSLEASTSDGSFTLREGYRLVVGGADGRLDIALDTTRDDWDRWSYDRDTVADQALAASPTYVTTYETDYDSFYGASDLSDYGTWTYLSSYGNCWIPRVSTGWAPYRFGQWIWIPSAGWTWLSSERWGWAPYHYGRWDFLPGFGWAWIPGFGSSYYGYGRSYYRWRPALVYFFNCDNQGRRYVGWYPLRPWDRWHRADRIANNYDHSHLRYPSAPDNWRRPWDDRRRRGTPDGASVLPVDGFARPNRDRQRPEAPSGGLDHWAGRQARPGLPDISPNGFASAPSGRRGDDQRRVPAPSPDVLRRPVVTRNRPADRDLSGDAKRERRLLPPRSSEVFRNNGAPGFDPNSAPNRERRDSGESTDSSNSNSGRPANTAAPDSPTRRSRPTTEPSRPSVGGEPATKPGRERRGDEFPSQGASGSDSGNRRVEPRGGNDSGKTRGDDSQNGNDSGRSRGNDSQNGNASPRPPRSAPAPKADRPPAPAPAPKAERPPAQAPAPKAERPPSPPPAPKPDKQQAPERNRDNADRQRKPPTVETNASSGSDRGRPQPQPSQAQVSPGRQRFESAPPARADKHESDQSGKQGKKNH